LLGAHRVCNQQKQAGMKGMGNMYKCFCLTVFSEVLLEAKTLSEMLQVEDLQIILRKVQEL
jgi:hypothetical protein